MSRYDNYDDYDRPTRAQQAPFPSITGRRQLRAPQRPWSPDNYYEEDEYAGDGGAIARYLASAEQERGLGTAGPSGQHWNDAYEARPSQAPRASGEGYSRSGHSRPEDMEMDVDQQYEGSSPRRHRNRKRRQEASEVSVEALDLADYSRTYSQRIGQASSPLHPRLRRGSLGAAAEVATDDYNRYPHYATPSRTVPSDLDDAPSRERPFSAQSRRIRGTVHSGRTSLGPPPSFVSARERLSSPSSQQSHRSSPRSAGKGIKASLPSQHTSLPPAFDATRPDPNAPDIRSFPKWSRGWYDSASKPVATPSSPPQAYNETDLGIWPPQAAAGASLDHRFDAGGASSSLPWGQTISQDGHTLQMSDPPQYVPESVKEERMRMLEKEFGSKDRGRAAVDVDRMIGSVNAEGTLITDGPKARAAVRVMQCILALAAAGAGIYGAVAIHPPKPAPPASTAPAYVLYAFSVVASLFSVYFFGIRPCLHRRRRSKQTGYSGQMGAPGMMVLPVVQGMHQKGKGGGQKGKKKKGQRGPEDGVQVNLIVDPSMFGGMGDGTGRSRGTRDDEDDASDACDSSRNSPSTPSRRRNRPKRKSVFETMALEADWKLARRRLKWQFTVDIALMVLSAAVFFFVLWGKRCPPGQYGGWCTAYNTSTACACLLAVAFGFGVFYDIKDLSASKVSPRTRT